jgi:hypothetical protein
MGYLSFELYGNLNGLIGDSNWYWEFIVKFKEAILVYKVI